MLSQGLENTRPSLRSFKTSHTSGVLGYVSEYKKLTRNWLVPQLILVMVTGEEVKADASGNSPCSTLSLNRVRLRHPCHVKALHALRGVVSEGHMGLG